VAAGTAAGISGTDSVVLGSQTVLWKRAGTVCDAYAPLFPLSQVLPKVQPALDAIGVAIHPLRPEDPEVITLMSKDPSVVACVKNIDDAVAAGARVDIGFLPKMRVGGGLVTLKEAREVCEAFMAKSAGIAKEYEATVAADAAALRAKWAKLGAAGQRLDFLIDRDNSILFGKGCQEIEGKARARSSVFYQMSEDDSFWWVYKTTFSKNKLKGEAVRKYNKLTQTWRCW
jgi:hypothetical protein